MAALEVDASAAVHSARYQVITRMCNMLYELAAYQTVHKQRELLIEIDAEITHLWDLHEVQDG